MGVPALHGSLGEQLCFKPLNVHQISSDAFGLLSVSHTPKIVPYKSSLTVCIVSLVVITEKNVTDAL